MITVNQLFYKGRKLKYIRDKTPALVPAFRKRKGFRFEKKPQAKGYCNKVFTRTPKKPNSAIRKLAKVKVYSTNSFVESYIPGMGHNLRGFSIILMRGGRTQDLPGVKYKCIRGKYDLVGVLNRFSARSRYGVKDLIKKVTKKL